MPYVLTIEGKEELQKQLRELEMRNPKLYKQSQQIMRTAIDVARRKVAAAARTTLMNDPRKAYQAVRASVWRKTLGGNVNILQKRKASGRQYVGGNIGARDATARTKALAGYYGKDRGFILRFINAGTDTRTSTGMNGHSIKRSSTSERIPKGNQMNRAYRVRFYKGGIGNRGAIEARDWFKSPASAGIQEAAEVYAALIERAIVEVWNN